MDSSDQEFLYPSQVSEFFWNRPDPAEIGKCFGGLAVFGEVIVTYAAEINTLVLCDPQFIDEDTILIEKVDAA